MCVSGKESVCVRAGGESMCEQERECARGRERESVCVSRRESVSESAFVRERVRVRVGESVCESGSESV